MAPVKVAVCVERIRLGQLAYEPQHASDPQKCESWKERYWRYTHRAVRRKRESGLVRVRVTLIAIDQVTLTRKPGMALSRLSNVGGSKRPEGE